MFEAYERLYPEREAISISEFVKPIGASANWVRAEIKRGNLKAIRRSKLILIPMSEVQRFFSERYEPNPPRR